jgi:hypothetical protein
MQKKPKRATPNSLPEHLDRWRRDGRMRAFGAITWRGGCISGLELAGILGVSPRALRQLLVRDGSFLVEYRSNKGDSGSLAYYRIAQKALSPALLPERVSATQRKRPTGLPAPKVEEYTTSISRFFA